jgi:hypothetical protein
MENGLLQNPHSIQVENSINLNKYWKMFYAQVWIAVDKTDVNYEENSWLILIIV